MSGGHGGGGGGDGFEEEPEPHENHERYLLTYADMITLLMALFIILFAIGQTDVEKYKKFQSGLRDSFGAPAIEGGAGVLQGVSNSTPNLKISRIADPGLRDPNELTGGSGSGNQSGEPHQITSYNADVTAQTIKQVLQESGLPSSEYEVDVDDRGVVIRLATDNVTFPSGSASLRGDHTQSLDVVGRVLQRVTNGAIIEGHTDDRPMGGGITNWELSALRAANVLRYLESTFKIPSGRLRVAGYADTRPVAANTTDDGRNRNRRVEVVIVVDEQAADDPSTSASIGPVVADPAKPAPVDALAPTGAARTAPTTTTAKR
jgi:chemotaxis protein MotB